MDFFLSDISNLHFSQILLCSCNKMLLENGVMSETYNTIPNLQSISSYCECKMQGTSLYLVEILVNPK